MLSNLQPKVAVVVLNYNTRSLLERFLPSVVGTAYSHLEVWVADNASSDDSVDFVKTHYPEINLLVSPENTGYAGGYNWALKQIEADYYVLLNSDVRVPAQWLNPMVEYAIQHPEVGAIQPKILDAKDERMFEYAGASGGLLDKWGYAFCRGRIFDHLEEDQGQYDDVSKVFWASGACLFIRSEVYHKSGGLDADFFAHMEEIDLCWRIQRMGYEVVVQPRSVVYHVGGGTLAEGSSRKYFLNFRNNLILLTKNLEGAWWMTLLWRMVLDGVSACKFVVSGKPELFGTIVKAHFAFWKKVRFYLSKRSEVKALGNRQVRLFPKSIVWNHFAKKVKKYSDL